MNAYWLTVVKWMQLQVIHFCDFGGSSTRHSRHVTNQITVNHGQEVKQSSFNNRWSKRPMIGAINRKCQQWRRRWAESRDGRVQSSRQARKKQKIVTSK